MGEHPSRMRVIVCHLSTLLTSVPSVSGCQMPMTGKPSTHVHDCHALLASTLSLVDVIMPPACGTQKRQQAAGGVSGHKLIN